MKKEGNEIIVSSKINLLIKIVLILSVPFLTLLLSNRYPAGPTLIGAFLSFGIGLYLVTKKVKVEKINIYKLILSLYISLFTIKEWIVFCKNSGNVLIFNKLANDILGFHFSDKVFITLMGTLAIPFTVFLVYLFIVKIIPKVWQFFKSFTKNEKRYVGVIVALAVILVVGITFKTTAFSKPYDGKVEWYDVIYTADSGSIVCGNAFWNISYEENDIRQPLFGVFALPFSIPAKILGDVFFFFPNDYAYEIILTIGQFILLAITTIMLGRMLKLSEDDKKYFYLLISCSFPYILFSFLLEQYVIALFYLILTFYYHWSKPEKTNYLYIGAVGTLITSGIVFPVITKFKNLKNWITSVFKCFLAFVAVLIVAGQLPQIFELVDKFNSLFGDFSHSSTLSDKLYQFTHFIKGIFLANPGHYETIFFHPSYQLIHFTNVSLVGIGLFILCIVGFILNKNNKMALISLLWIGFSILILFVLGWGTAENGLVLYSLYFAWAYLILYFLFFKTIFKKKIIFKICIIVSCAIMLIFNINEFLKILKFALIYY